VASAPLGFHSQLAVLRVLGVVVSTRPSCMNSGDRRPTSEKRHAHRERLVQQTRNNARPMDVATQDLAGQRRERVGQDEEQTTPPTKQGRNNEDQAELPVEAELGSDLQQMYIDNDAKAYEVDRTLEKNRKFYFQKKYATDEAKQYAASKMKQNANGITRIKLTSPNNKHSFQAEQVAYQVATTLRDVDFEINFQDIVVTAMSATGPFIAAMHEEAAQYLLEEGMMLIDPTQDPPVTQFFEAKPFNANHTHTNSSSNADDIALSIYFNLGAEYTGMHLNQLSEQQERITKALTEVFGEPSDFLSYVFVQPKSQMGFYRNAIRAIVKYNKQNENKVEPKDVNDLAKLRYVGMGFGKRPVSATMAAGWRAAYGIEQCCFRQKEFCTKTDTNECDLRAKMWAKYSYSDNNNRLDYSEKKRKREEDQKNQRDSQAAIYKQIQMERLAADCCNFFLQGKCSKNARDCSRPHRSLRFSKAKISCASSKPNLNWVCAWNAETCPYAHHVDAQKK